mmetsp:Transcript_6281/g.17909  ORF Transcript_6281/g.17909 Transcript_6281/m.17909 type:complete len:235 (-) Transcript_6281:44-748(-)
MLLHAHGLRQAVGLEVVHADGRALRELQAQWLVLEIKRPSTATAHRDKVHPQRPEWQVGSKSAQELDHLISAVMRRYILLIHTDDGPSNLDASVLGIAVEVKSSHDYAVSPPPAGRGRPAPEPEAQRLALEEERPRVTGQVHKVHLQPKARGVLRQAAQALGQVGQQCVEGSRAAQLHGADPPQDPAHLYAALPGEAVGLVVLDPEGCGFGELHAQGLPVEKESPRLATNSLEV